MVSTFLVGLTFGVVGKYLIHGNKSSNFLGPTLAGIVGAFMAHFFGGSTGMYKSDDPVGLLATSLGAILLLVIYAVAFKKYQSNRTIRH